MCVTFQSLKEELEGVKNQMKTEEKKSSGLAEKISELEVSALRAERKRWRDGC